MNSCAFCYVCAMGIIEIFNHHHQQGPLITLKGSRQLGNGLYWRYIPHLFLLSLNQIWWWQAEFSLYYNLFNSFLSHLNHWSKVQDARRVEGHLFRFERQPVGDGKLEWYGLAGWRNISLVIGGIFCHSCWSLSHSGRQSVFPIGCFTLI